MGWGRFDFMFSVRVSLVVRVEVVFRVGVWVRVRFRVRFRARFCVMVNVNFWVQVGLCLD